MYGSPCAVGTRRQCWVHRLRDSSVQFTMCRRQCRHHRLREGRVRFTVCRRHEKTMWGSPFARQQCRVHHVSLAREDGVGSTVCEDSVGSTIYGGEWRCCLLHAQTISLAARVAGWWRYGVWTKASLRLIPSALSFGVQASSYLPHTALDVAITSGAHVPLQT